MGGGTEGGTEDRGMARAGRCDRNAGIGKEWTISRTTLYHIDRFVECLYVGKLHSTRCHRVDLISLFE